MSYELGGVARGGRREQNGQILGSRRPLTYDRALDRERRRALAERRSATGPEQSGTVKWFDPDKGYGFIVPDGGGADVLVHIRIVEASGRSILHKSQRITFVAGESRRRGKLEAKSLKAAT